MSGFSHLGFGASVSADRTLFTTPKETGRVARTFFRSWSDEHGRFFYWDEVTNQTTWEEPSLSDKLIDHATMREVVRSPAPTVNAPATVLSALTSSLTSSGLNGASLLQSTTSSKVMTSSLVQEQPTASSSSGSAAKQSLAPNRLREHPVSIVSSSVVSPQKALSPEKQRELEEADRRLAEQLQAEIDKEFEERRAALPSPAEALARLREQKAKQQQAKHKTTGSNNAELAKDIADNGLVVKVSKKKGRH